ncbi:glutathione S-transferase [Zychaea mexicana]|uniref:glutathione S-transferase n=1 Tax=Zychaea mexicana TaxID=64656 RepID=UPI0022FEB0B6|nr:glutathione S-transferase [Zychaea mexicana]KAI9498661.1 glutathione S-transferase [Zychaea mexicana]
MAPSPQIVLYDLKLVDAPGLIWSPNTCKTRYALNYKGIPYKTVWLTYPEVHSEIPKLTKKDGRPTVPVIVDLLHDSTVVQDSWEIVKYLEEVYPDTPKLFNTNSIGAHLFFQDYCTQKLLFAVVFRLVLSNMIDLAGEHKEWFIKTREAFLGMSIKEFIGDDPTVHAKALTQNLEPIGKILKTYPYISGQQIGWSDIVFTSSLRMLVAFRPDSFGALVLDDKKAGKQFQEWWNRMDKYMQLEPPCYSV